MPTVTAVSMEATGGLPVLPLGDQVNMVTTQRRKKKSKKGKNRSNSRRKMRRSKSNSSTLTMRK